MFQIRLDRGAIDDSLCTSDDRLLSIMLTRLMPAAGLKILAFLLVNSAEECYLREIARRAGVPLKGGGLAPPLRQTFGDYALLDTQTEFLRLIRDRIEGRW